MAEAEHEVYLIMRSPLPRREIEDTFPWRRMMLFKWHPQVRVHMHYHTTQHDSASLSEEEP